MGIEVVFEIILSALAVFGLFALICEAERWMCRRKRYYIAVPAENDDPDTERQAEAARRIAHISTGAEHEVVLLFDGKPDARMRERLQTLPDTVVYVRYKERMNGEKHGFGQGSPGLQRHRGGNHIHK